MTKFNCDRVDAILLDIEGTTMPVDYVFGILFPFAKARVESFLLAHSQESAVQADLERLRLEYQADVNCGASVPAWDNTNSL